MPAGWPVILPVLIVWPISAKFAGNTELTKIIVSLCFQKLSARKEALVLLLKVQPTGKGRQV